MCELFQLHPEHPGLFERWLRLAKQAAIHGKRAYDARIAAFMALYGIEFVLTLNPNDFHGFGVNVVEPDTLVDGPLDPPWLK
ncbi:MAG TPA: hypothetical protein VNM22_21300 [Candidatus Limnocylindrales bacterium]|nr:hypothetical protein [Candidatus Limnocylindrales bacterium]